ncbi:MAG: hypothetical protein ACD_2C00144G0001 [uncultured bacterium (gcode 4)]|uniref:Uncharacterized protein n=1 Tax=uncultured bacterium (gcode 4) TaxID=1234023 RepID=K2FEG0_9BACT|nr:MAG: hypothetical protein ACD_2C00144G0001 [uncultured bacterium (gcode 4)]
MAITIENHAWISAVLVSDTSYAISNSHFISSYSPTLTHPSSSSMKLPAFASLIISWTLAPNLGPIRRAFGLQIFFAMLHMSATITSFTFNSSFMISM